MLRENLDELQQTVNLMQSDNHDEFFDISIRNKKFGRVDAMNGPILLEKYVLRLHEATRIQVSTDIYADLRRTLRALLGVPLSPTSHHDLAS